jgi:hypothetical protein
VAAGAREVTPTAIACRKAFTERGKVMIHTDVYLEEKVPPPGNLPGLMTVKTGVTVTIPAELLEDLGSHAFRYWLDWLTVCLLEPPGPELPRATVERFYKELGYIG